MPGADSFNHVLKTSGILVAYFSHDACGVCKVLRPKVQNLINEMAGPSFYYVNTVESPQIAGQYLVFAVPTVIIFVEGREAKRYSRHFSVGELQDFLHRLTQTG